MGIVEKRSAPFPISDVLAGADGNNTSYSLQHIGTGSNAIAAAASQAIAATQQLTGRRTSSLKASFEAINLGMQSHEFSIGRELAGAAGIGAAASSSSSQASFGADTGFDGQP